MVTRGKNYVEEYDDIPSLDEVLVDIFSRHNGLKAQQGQIRENFTRPCRTTATTPLFFAATESVPGVYLWNNSPSNQGLEKWGFTLFFRRTMSACSL